MTPQLRIGTSGWDYPGWRGALYPDALPRSKWLEHASRTFNSLELNGTFYSLRKPVDFREWYDRTPSGFRFAIKGSRFITHAKKLAEVATPLANFFASGVLLLREKLGPILWQLPAGLRFDEDRAERFFRLLPRDTHAAARLAGRHDSRLDDRSHTHGGDLHRLRHVVEVRHESFLVPAFVRLLRRYGIALASSDAPDWPYTEELTAGFVYVRLHGHAETYASRYGTRRLEALADRIRRWRDGKEPDDAKRITDRVPPRRKHRDVYVYFDNDREANAPGDALELARESNPHPTPAGGCDSDPTAGREGT